MATKMSLVSKCPLCSSFAAKSFKGVLRHIGTVHAHDPTFTVRCSVGDCPRVYKNYHSYKKHIYKKHREVLMDDTTLQSCDDSVSDPVHTEEGPSEAFCTSEDEECDTPCSSKTREKVAALFILKLKHIHKVSQRSLTGLLSDCSSMLESELHSLRTQVMATLDNSIDATLKGKISQLFQCHSTRDIYNGLTTEHLQKAFFREEFHLLVCHPHSTLCRRRVYFHFYRNQWRGGLAGE